MDNETSEPLPFATIALKNKGKGTVTNNNGNFGMKIPPNFINDTLSFSYLGYLGREIPVKKAFEKNLTISMKRDYISIPGDNHQKSESDRKSFYGHLRQYPTIMATHLL